MNTIKKFRNLFFILFGLGLLNSCVQDDQYDIPSLEIPCDDIWESNMTLHQLVALIDADSDGIVKFEEETIIEGYVISDDNPGNFFKTISIQDSPTNPTIGIQVEIDEYNLANFYPLGSKIKINLKDIYAGFDRGVIKVGETYVQGSETRVGRMRASIFKDHVKRACGNIEELEPVVFETIDAAKESGILNTLITINNVQFAEKDANNQDQLGQPFAPPSQTVNKILQDASGSTIDLRNSGYADFATQIVPEGSGSITVVLSKFGSSFQIFIRDENDLKFDQPRFEVSDGSGPVGGGSASYDACLTENFESYSVDASSFPSYINFAYSGNRYWQIKSFDGNKYIQMSAFNSTNPTNTSYFIVPVDFTNADSFSFKTKDGYNNGAALKVYYTTNYAIGGTFSPSSLVDITSSFTISSGNANGYGNNFINSGDYSLASLSGNGAIVFKYEGSASGVTTTMQIDDIKITDNENPSCN